MQLLQRHFLQADIDNIVQIKLCSRNTEDVLAWAPTKNGVFTVKSAYWLGMDELNRPHLGSTSRAPNGQRPIWKVTFTVPWYSKTKRWSTR